MPRCGQPNPDDFASEGRLYQYVGRQAIPSIWTTFVALTKRITPRSNLRLLVAVFCITSFSLGISHHRLLNQDANPCETAVRQFSTNRLAARNQGKFEDVAAMFNATGDVIDKDKVVYSGREVIKTLAENFAEKFAKATMSSESESIRFVGPLAIDDGTRIITNDDAATSSGSNAEFSSHSANHTEFRRFLT